VTHFPLQLFEVIVWTAAPKKAREKSPEHHPFHEKKPEHHHLTSLLLPKLYPALALWLLFSIIACAASLLHLPLMKWLLYSNALH
jgi:hypothetical protein